MKVKQRKINKFHHGTFNATDDLVAIEEPFEIRLGYGKEDDRAQMQLAVTMRTPGDDEYLAIGFLFTEGIISSIDQVLSIKPCVDTVTGKLTDNIIRVELTPETELDPELFKRNFYTTSSCGICGKASIESIESNCKLRIPDQTIQISGTDLGSMLDAINETQSVFNFTGGIHASAIFSKKLTLEYLTEDVGRHNALDKAIGYAVSADAIPFYDKVILLSGRASFELIQKAAMVGCSVVCAIGAPSSLAIETADSFNITLVGFLKKERFNIYTHDSRITGMNSSGTLSL